MPVTIVKCSSPGCRADADSKIAAPWKGGAFSELKTYGYACPQHADAVVALAEKRPKPGKLAPDESVGTIGTYELAGV